MSSGQAAAKAATKATASGLLPAGRQRSAPGWRIGIGRAALGVALVALWQLLHRWLGPDVMADLRDILARLLEIARNGLLAKHLGVTLYESALGLLIGAVAGLVLPFALRLSPRLEHALQPFIGAAMGVPKLALAPLVILWFGVGIASKVAFVASVVFFLIFFSTMAGIQAADSRLVAMARVSGAGRWFLVREVLLPGAVPMILPSVKIAAPRAISAAVVGEFMASDAGLGNYIHQAMDQSDTVGIFTGVLVVTAVVVAINVLLQRLQRRLLRWREAGLSGF
jgi:NitT/TauT family transport system permease protein